MVDQIGSVNMYWLCVERDRDALQSSVYLGGKRWKYVCLRLTFFGVGVHGRESDSDSEKIRVLVW